MNLTQDIDAPVFHTVGRVADTLGCETYVVGGFVRDIFLGRKSDDLDFVTVGSGIRLAKAVAKELGRGAHLAVFANYGTAQVKWRGYELEFVGARKESYSRESRNPIVEDGTLQDDQERRDFTINAMAICINEQRFGELVDPFAGIADLNRGEIRTPLDPDITFSDDPLRMLRAIRFATRFGFRIVPETFKAIAANRERIRIITKERINEELMKIMATEKPSVGFRLLDMAGLLEIIFPELHALKGVEMREGKGHKDNFLHTLQVVDNVAAKSDDLWLRWAALMHDIAKPVTKKYEPGQGWTFRNHNYIGEKMVPRIFRGMKLPLNEKMKYVAKLVGLHMRPQQVGEEGVTDSGVRRMITEAGDAIDDLMTLAEADITSKNPDKVRRILNNFALVRERVREVNEKDEYRNWKNPVNGNEIMELFAIEPSGVVARIKQDIKDAILDCRVDNNHDAAFDYMLSIAPAYGLAPVADAQAIRERYAIPSAPSESVQKPSAEKNN